MAITGETIANVGSGALQIIVLIFLIIVVGAIVLAVTMALMRYKRYTQYKCVVWEKDGTGQVNETYDTAGIFVDKKTKNKRFFMRKANVGLEPDNVPYLPAGGKKTVYLYRTGLKNFYFVRPSFVSNPTVAFTVGEEDVNWAINAYDRQKKLFQQSKLLQFLPFIALAFTAIIILSIFIYFFKEFATLKEVAVAMKEAALALG